MDATDRHQFEKNRSGRNVSTEDARSLKCLESSDEDVTLAAPAVRWCIQKDQEGQTLRENTTGSCYNRSRL